VIGPATVAVPSAAPSPASTARLAHHFTVDVEEYFQVSALDPYVPRDRWDTFESRLLPAVERLLDLMSAANATGTFFVLGWAADRVRSIVPLIRAGGHEIASHGWDHRRVPGQTPDQFRTSVRRAKVLLEDQAGTRVRGFRAPSFSILPGFEWALDVLIEEGHDYDSSLFPIRRSGYGYPSAPADPYVFKRPGGSIVEFPLTTLKRFGARVPAAGGGYFRLLPYGLTATALADCERRGAPGTFYIHPWEWDPGQPRLPVSPLTRIRHYGGLHRTWPRLERLLSQFRFTSLESTLDTGF
jgi:polysaccharide deacetylase family protein (PEP-CTERM system associated)